MQGAAPRWPQQPAARPLKPRLKTRFAQPRHDHQEQTCIVGDYAVNGTPSRYQWRIGQA
jgi:hypothetical protein